MEPPDGRVREVVLATRNPGKLREIRQVLSPRPVRVVTREAFADVAEPEETGATFAENARSKALYYARATGRWSLADDSGLVVDALDGAPGVHSARYAAEFYPPDADRPTRDAANTAKLLAAMAFLPAGRRAGRFVCHLALADADAVLLETSGTLPGHITRRPRGRNGFGYDPVFLLSDRGQTAAELSPAEKNAVSHRGQAVRLFARRLGEFLLARGEADAQATEDP